MLQILHQNVRTEILLYRRIKKKAIAKRTKKKTEKKRKMKVKRRETRTRTRIRISQRGVYNFKQLKMSPLFFKSLKVFLF